MRKTKREGFQFSFGLKQQQQNVSARSTPKFPSIQINKNSSKILQKSSNNRLYQTEPIEVRKSALDMFKQIGGGMELLQKGNKPQQNSDNRKLIANFAYNDALSIESNDNKSVKSTKSLGERFLRKFDKQIPETSTKTNNKKHSNSLANILDMKLESPKRRNQLLKNGSLKKSNYSFNKQPLQIIEDEKNSARDTLKLQNTSFFQSGSKNIDFRQTKKMLQTFQRNKLQIGDREKSKIFKNFLHKPRPTLRINQHRTLNNEKIEHFSKRFQGEGF